MRILLLSNLFPPGFLGGYELGALDVATGLKRLGHDVHVLTSNHFLDDGGVYADLDVRRQLVCTAFVHYSPDHRGNQLDGPFYSFNNLRSLGATMRDVRPDIVMAFNLMGLGAIATMQYLQSLAQPTVLYLMDNIFAGAEGGSAFADNYFSIVGRLEIVESTHVIAMSRVVAREIEKTLAFDLPNVTYIPGWVDKAGAEGVTRTPRATGTRFVYYSAVVRHKGIEFVLDAAESLIRSGHSDFTVDIIGGGEVPSLLEGINRRGLGGVVNYRGVVAKGDAAGILSAYDALLFPTHHREPFGFVAVEAAAVGCVPIMTAGIGASEWLRDGQECLLIERSGPALQSKMLEVMRMSEADLLQLRATVAEGTGRLFAFDHWIKEIEGVCLRASARSDGNSALARTRQSESALLILATIWRETLDSAWSLRRVLFAYRRNRGLRLVRFIEEVLLPFGSRRRARVKRLFLNLF